MRLRGLHPGAWWLWALGLAAAASGTTNPLVLLLVLTVAGVVVAARRSDAPWARAYATFLKIGLVVLLLRVGVQTLFGAATSGTVLLRLPEVPLPGWMAGVRLGGAITLEGVAAAAYDGLRLGVLLCCVGAANSLANPSRLLRALPGALYEMGVALTVALSFAPQAVTSVGRVRRARRLRGRRDRGLRSVRGLALPVLEGALERSVALAAAMDSRGYGRRVDAAPARRRLSLASTATGLLAVCVGLYGVLGVAAPALLGLPVLLLGVALAAVGLVTGGRVTPRSRYRADPWGLPEWVVAASGLVAALGVALGDPLLLAPSTSPLVAPALPLLPTLAVLLALLPAVLAPDDRPRSTAPVTDVPAAVAA